MTEITKSEISKIGDEMVSLMEELFPICRSITGNGLRKTLQIINKKIPLDIREIPSGTKVFDWEIPKEWNINDAYIIDPNGKKIVDFKKSNLHVLNYSTPISKKMDLEELIPHLYTIPNKPDVIPYLTSYYNENWGFCISHKQFQSFVSGEYEVVIDSTLKNGSLTYGECYFEGKTNEEVLISTYVCHPSLCNDNLSGVVLTTLLAEKIKNHSKNFSYRFLFVPETIGAIAWLSQNEKNIHKIKHGLVSTCVGDPGKITYKKSKQGNTEIDKIVTYVLKQSNQPHRILDYFPMGSDERQFCSPGFNLPVGSLFRSRYGTNEFPEYHTSDDNLGFISKESMEDSFMKYFETISIIENNKKYKTLNPKCEPFLGKRNLYRTIGGQTEENSEKDLEFALKWVLSYSNGHNSILDIAEISKMPFSIIKKASDTLYEIDLLKMEKNDNLQRTSF